MKVTSWLASKREEATWRQAKEILVNSKTEPKFILNTYNMLTEPRFHKLWRLFYRINFRNNL